MKKIFKSEIWVHWLEKKLEKSGLSIRQRKNIIVSVDFILNMAIIVVLVMLIRTFIVAPFQVYGISMCESLNFHNGKCNDGYGDYILINKSAYLKIPFLYNGLPRRGDIIVFKPPKRNGDYYIKRIIGLPGETIKLRDGFVYLINGNYEFEIPLNENYLSEESLGKTYSTGEIEIFHVPDDKYFVLGDNRLHSSDSRICFKDSAGAPGCENDGITPYLSQKDIEGKAAIRIWPETGIIKNPKY